MRHRGPLLTLVAVVGLALVLLVVNRTTGGSAPPASTAAAPPVQQSGPSTAATPTAAAPLPGSPPPSRFPATARYVGRAITATRPIPLAITIDGERATAYLCDGKNIEAWLQGTARDGGLDLTGKRGNRLTGSLTEKTITGTVLVAGHPEWRFTATPAAGSRAGIYRASGRGSSTGWIVPDDTGDGQVGITRDVTGARAPAPYLYLDTASAQNPADLPRPVDGDTDVLTDR